MAREGVRIEEKQATEGQAHAANGQLSEAKKHLKAQLFDAEMQRAISQEELALTEGRQ